MVRRDNTKLIDLRSDVKSVFNALDRIQYSDSFIEADMIASQKAEESKWDSKIATLNNEVQMKTGVNLTELQAKYRIKLWVQRLLIKS